jgi:hypothetical protein
MNQQRTSSWGRWLPIAVWLPGDPVGVHRGGGLARPGPGGGAVAGLGAIAALLLLERLAPKVPASLVVLAAAIGDDGGDQVSTSYPHRFEFAGGEIVKVVFDIANDAYTDVEAHLAAAMARD